MNCFPLRSFALESLIEILFLEVTVMGYSTDEIRRMLKKAKSYNDVKDAHFINGDFAKAVSDLIERRKKEKGVTQEKLLRSANLGHSTIANLKNSRNRKKPDRDTILDLCLALDASLEETNELLKLSRNQELYVRDRKDSIIYWGLLHKKKGDEIREVLLENGFDFEKD